MSLPTWAKIPVVGARQPMRSSSAPTLACEQMRSASTLPKLGQDLPGVVQIMFRLPGISVASSAGHDCELLRLRAIRSATLANTLRNPHQAHWQVKNGQHIDCTEGVLPPRDHGAEILAHGGHDEA